MTPELYNQLSELINHEKDGIVPLDNGKLNELVELDAEHDRLLRELVVAEANYKKLVSNNTARIKALDKLLSPCNKFNVTYDRNKIKSGNITWLNQLKTIHEHPIINAHVRAISSHAVIRTLERYMTKPNYNLLHLIPLLQSNFAEANQVWIKPQYSVMQLINHNVGNTKYYINKLFRKNIVYIVVDDVIVTVHTNECKKFTRANPND